MWVCPPSLEGAPEWGEWMDTKCAKAERGVGHGAGALILPLLFKFLLLRMGPSLDEMLLPTRRVLRADCALWLSCQSTFQPCPLKGAVLPRLFSHECKTYYAYECECECIYFIIFTILENSYVIQLNRWWKVLQKRRNSNLFRCQRE